MQSDLWDTLNFQKCAGNVFICPVAEKKELLIGLMKNQFEIEEALSKIDSQNSFPEHRLTTIDFLHFFSVITSEIDENIC